LLWHGDFSPAARSACRSRRSTGLRNPLLFTKPAGQTEAGKKGWAEMQRTLAIVKPDGVSRGVIGEVIKRQEANGLKIVAAKLVRMSLAQAEGFYAVHRGKPFFANLTAFMSSGPALVMALEGDDAIACWRNLMGATNYREAAAGTIRADFATDIERNVVHGSDAPETAAFEIGYFFNCFELVG
jgi:nucleoside-diphosphate kinase